MKKIIYILSCGIIAFCLACGGDSDPVTEPEPDVEGVIVSISTQIETKAVVKTLFSKNDEMNIWAKSYGKTDAPNLVDNIKAVYDGSKWTLTPQVPLQEGGKAFIYAISPYSALHTNPGSIEIDISRQEDVLYSGSFVPVTYTTNQAKLTMKHALALAAFNIDKQGYNGKGNLESVNISGENVYTTGTMSVEKGKVTGVGKKDFTFSVTKQISEGGWTNDLPRMWCIPFSTRGVVAKLKASIDGKVYETAFPEVEMKSGYQYVFRLVLTNYGLEFIPNLTETISLNNETDKMQALDGYGILQIAHSSTDFTLPFLTGDNVFGTVTWGDGSNNSYSYDGKHTYIGTGTWPILIESWNSTGFELDNLIGVETIDVSDY